MLPVKPRVQARKLYWTSLTGSLRNVRITEESKKEKKKNLTGGDDIGSSRGKVGGLFSVEMQQ